MKLGEIAASDRSVRFANKLKFIKASKPEEGNVCASK